MVSRSEIYEESRRESEVSPRYYEGARKMYERLEERKV